MFAHMGRIAYSTLGGSLMSMTACLVMRCVQWPSGCCDVVRRRQQELEELHEELEYQLRFLLDKPGTQARVFAFLLVHSLKVSLNIPAAAAVAASGG